MQPLRGAPFTEFQLGLHIPSLKTQTASLQENHWSYGTAFLNSLLFSECVCVCVQSSLKGVRAQLNIMIMCMHLEIRECMCALHHNSSLSVCSGEKSDRKMCPLDNYSSSLHTCYQGSKFTSANQDTIYKSERLGGGGAWVQDNCNLQNGFSCSCAEFCISLLSQLCTHTQTHTQMQICQNWNETNSQTRKWEWKKLDKSGWCGVSGV